MEIRANVWLALLTLFFAFSAHASKTISKEYYANGKLKSVTKTRVTVPRNIDPFNFYKRTKTERVDFDSATGRRIRETTKITMVGNSGRRCYEVYLRQIDYDLAGNRVRFEKSKCDKSKSKVKEYQNGKVAFIRKQKRRRILWW